MIAKYMIDKYISDAIETAQTVKDKDELKLLNVLISLLSSNEYVIKAATDNFDINNAPNIVLIFDTNRCMFWKQNGYGYTDSISDSGAFDLEEAKKIVKHDYNCNTKIVWF